MNRIKGMLRVFTAVFIKNGLEYIRYPANFIFSLFMPVVWTLPIYFLIRSFTPDGTSAGLLSWTGSANFYGYFLIGMVVAYINMSIFWNTGFSLKRLMDIGMLETTWGLPIGKTIYILAESLFSVFRLVYEMILVIIIFRFLFGMRLPAGFAAMIPWFIPFFMLMYGLGIGFAALVLLVKDANTMVDTASFLINGVTGTQNPPQVFPRFLLTIAMMIPITYFLDILRAGSLGITPLLPPVFEGLIVAAGSIIIPVAGFLFFKYTDRRCRITGSLHVH